MHGNFRLNHAGGGSSRDDTDLRCRVERANAFNSVSWSTHAIRRSSSARSFAEIFPSAFSANRAFKRAWFAGDNLLSASALRSRSLKLMTGSEPSVMDA